MSKRTLYLLALALGGLGLLVCIVVGVAIWVVQARLRQVADSVFEAFDDSVAVAQQRVDNVDARVEALKVSAEDIERSLKSLATAEATERLTARLQAGTAQLATGVEQADHWLAISESSVQLVQEALKVSDSFGFSVESEPIDRLLEELNALRAKLTQANARIEEIVTRLAQGGDAQATEDARNQVVQIALRVMATVGAVDTRLENLSGQLQAVQTKAHDVQARTRWWLRAAALGVTLLVGWMAAGQASLCRTGWRGIRPMASAS